MVTTPAASCCNRQKCWCKSFKCDLLSRYITSNSSNVEPPAGSSRNTVTRRLFETKISLQSIHVTKPVCYESYDRCYVCIGYSSNNNGRMGSKLWETELCPVAKQIGLVSTRFLRKLFRMHTYNRSNTRV